MEPGLEPSELKRLRQKSYEVMNSNLIIQERLELSTWNQIAEYVNKHEKQVGFIKKSFLQGNALWDEVSQTSKSLFESIFNNMKHLFDEKGLPASEEKIAVQIVDALTYIDIQTSGVLPEQQQYDGKDGCVGGICYTLRSMQAKVWWKLCVVTMFQYGNAFDQFYKNLGNTEAALENFVRRNSDLLFNSVSSLFVKRLHEKLSWKRFHFLLVNLRDEDGRTFIYHEKNSEVLIKFYTSDHRADLYKLLSVPDKNGQTALHYNSSGLTKFLIYSFSPPGSQTCELFYQLINIKDNENKTAIDYSNDVDRARILWLMDQAKTGCYALYRPSVALLFNSVNRPLASKEPYAMVRALEGIGIYPTRHENFNQKSLEESIDEAANRTMTALIIMVMAHGSKGYILDANNEPLYIQRIQDKMCSYEHLKEKPKILIMQCCQQLSAADQFLNHKRNDGRPPKDKIQADCPPFIPNKDHFCAYMSCVEGQPAPRNVFIPAIAEQMRMSDKTTSLHDIFEGVKVRIAEDGQISTPIMHSTLHGKVCMKNVF